MNDLNPSTLTCQLCSYVGGAYKQLDEDGKWVHSLCSTMIPDLYVKFIDGINCRVVSKKLNEKRFRLKCSLCDNKGACVQCNYGRCMTAAHPWCVLHTPGGFVRESRIHKNGSVVWKIFCKAHSSASVSSSQSLDKDYSAEPTVAVTKRIKTDGNEDGNDFHSQDKASFFRDSSSDVRVCE
jgi:hypothetical protein